MDSYDASSGKTLGSPEMKRVVVEYSEVFRYTLPIGLLPERSIDHEIKTDPEAEIPNRRLFKSSLDKLRATREYTAENLPAGRIRLCKSPY